MNVGFSTGAVARGAVGDGIVVNRELGADLVEVSALHEAELPSVLDAWAARPDGFARLSVHGPIKGRVMAEAELVDILDRLGAPVVMHPDVFADLSLWERLGGRLLVENNDGRKSFGQGPADLDLIFEALPQARFCLDVSHALHAGGDRHPTALAARYRDRLVQLHAGCACGETLGYDLSQQVTGAVAAACDTVGAALPVVLERTTPAGERNALEGQLAAIRSL